MEKIKFEDKLDELEAIINKLESDKINLYDSIEEYTKAVKIVKECDKELSDIEEHISKIVLENGEVKDFKIDDENNT